jgi:hypothetical protein
VNVVRLLPAHVGEESVYTARVVVVDDATTETLVVVLIVALVDSGAQLAQHAHFGWISVESYLQSIRIGTAYIAKRLLQRLRIELELSECRRLGATLTCRIDMCSD